MAVPPAAPLLSIAITQPRFGGFIASFEAARRAMIRWADLELTGSRFALNHAARRRAASETGVSIRALWVPSLSDGTRRYLRPEACAKLTVEVARASGAIAVILDPPDRDGRHPARQARLIATVRERLPADTRLTLVLRPSTLDGTREHLTSLAALRRQAEEWDFDVALDLKGPVDHAWESEAAVSKILPRLTVVRFGPIESRPPGRGRERQTARVLAHLVDVGYQGAVAI